MTLGYALIDSAGDDEDEPAARFIVGDTVKVWWANEDEWYQGRVDKVTLKTVEVYYEDFDAFSTHHMDRWTIEKMDNIGHEPNESKESDSDSDDDCTALGVLLAK